MMGTSLALHVLIHTRLDGLAHTVVEQPTDTAHHTTQWCVCAGRVVGLDRARGRNNHLRGPSPWATSKQG